MNRHRRTTVVLTVALVTASMASAGVYRAVTRIPVREVEVAHHHIVLAARALPLGTLIEKSDIKLVAWPSSSPLPGAFTRLEEVTGRGLIAGVSENEPILESRLAPESAGAGLSPAIPPGMRAISIKVNEVIGVAGFAVPGVRVDVVATVRHPTDAVARILVSNVQVLTAGTRYEQQQPRDAKPVPSTVVTLIVTPAQAERIALASAEGQLTLMLRNPLDTTDAATGGVRLAKLADDPPSQTAPPPVPSVRVEAGRRVEPKSAATAPPAPRAAAIAAPAQQRIEAIRAGKRSEETLK